MPPINSCKKVMSACGTKRTSLKNSAMSAFDPNPTGLSVPPLSFAGRKQGVADLDLMGEFATQKLIDKPGNFCLMVEEMTERSPVENQCSYDALSSHCGLWQAFQLGKRLPQ